jgi:hypothetical protein
VRIGIVKRANNGGIRPHPFIVVLLGGVLVLLVVVFLVNRLIQPATVSTSIPSLPALPLLSQNAPAYANDDCGGAFPASRADDSNYGTQWEACATPSATHPIWLAYDLSHALHGGPPGKVILAWYNDPDSGSITSFDNPPSAYNNVGAYTIDVNAAPGGTAAPTTGWVTLVTVTGNTWASRQHVLDMTGNNWVRLTVTAPNGTSGNMGVAINMDIQDASAIASGDSPQDDWLFLGDSITAAGMNHDPRGIGVFAQLVSGQTGGKYYPVQQDLGLGGTTASYGAATITTWLPNFPGKYVALDYGTNDANGCGVSNTAFYNSYVTMVQAVLEAGKVPVVPYIPWAPNTSVQRCAGDPDADPNVSPHLNAMITKLYQDPTYGSQIIKGPNLWQTFLNQPNLFQDSLHPNETTGYDTYRNAWVSAMVANVYAGKSETASRAPTALVQRDEARPGRAYWPWPLPYTALLLL